MTLPAPMDAPPMSKSTFNIGKEWRVGYWVRYDPK